MTRAWSTGRSTTAVTRVLGNIVSNPAGGGCSSLPRAAFVGGVDEAIEGAAAACPVGGMRMSSTTMCSAQIMRAMTLPMEPSTSAREIAA